MKLVCFLSVDEKKQNKKRLVVWQDIAILSSLFTKEYYEELQKIYINFYHFKIFAIIKLLKNKDNKREYLVYYIITSNLIIPGYVTNEDSFKRLHFALFDDGLTLTTLKQVVSVFAFD